jgi:hypothetical protein
MVNRATPALDIWRIRGQVEWGGGGGGKDERDCEAVESGEMQNDRGNETNRFHPTLRHPSPLSRRRFLLSEIHRPRGRLFLRG